jgi:glycerophosphoryl diester phosphodiesterase
MRAVPALGAVVLAVAACAGPAAPAAGTARAPAAAAACPVLVAHKGLHWPYSGYPENSLGGEQAAFRAGAPWAETDVHTSKDGLWVVIHDWTVDRTTTRTGLVSSYTAAQLGAMHLTLQPGAGDPTTSVVPGLARFLQIARWNHGHVEVEISPGRVTGAQLAAFIRAYDSQQGWKYDRVSSFYPAVLAAVRHADPRIRTDLLLFGGFAPAAGSVQEDVPYAKLTAATVARLHRDRIQADAWTPDDPAAWHKLTVMGVDMITTDDVHGYLRGC